MNTYTTSLVAYFICLKVPVSISNALIKCTAGHTVLLVEPAIYNTPPHTLFAALP